jgi:hypothetical protein
VEASFGLATSYGLCLFLLLLLPPSRLRRSVVVNLWTYLPLLLLYLAVLFQSWEADTLSLMLPGSLSEALATGKPQFFPTLAGIQSLLSRRATAASAWVHLLAVNAFLGRHVYLEGCRRRVPTHHSLLLALFAGPAGLACHLLTVAAVAALRRARARRVGGGERGAVAG